MSFSSHLSSPANVTTFLFGQSCLRLPTFCHQHLPLSFSSPFPSLERPGTALFLLSLPSNPRLLVTSPSPVLFGTPGSSPSYLGVFCRCPFLCLSLLFPSFFACGSRGLHLLSAASFSSLSFSPFSVSSGHHGRGCTLVQYLSQTSHLQ